MWTQCVQVQRKRPLQGQAASMPEIEGLTCWRSDGVQGGRRQPELILPEEILYQIHALMPNCQCKMLPVLPVCLGDFSVLGIAILISYSIAKRLA